MYSVQDNERFHREFTIRYPELKNFNPFRPFFRGATRFLARADFVYHEHRHDYYEIILPLHGEYACLLNGETVSLAPGQLLAVQPGDRHRDLIRAGQEFFSIALDLELRDPGIGDRRIFRAEAGARERIAGWAERPGLAGIFTLFRELGAEDSPRSYYVLNGLCQAFFWELVPAFPATALVPVFVRDTAQEQFKNALYELFESRLNGPLRVSEIAARLRLSPRSLVRRCREVLGMPPVQAFTALRMRRAEEYVRLSELSLKEISVTLGFENQYHFSRCFKAHFGISPSAWRRGRTGSE